MLLISPLYDSEVRCSAEVAREPAGLSAAVTTTSTKISEHPDRRVQASEPIAFAELNCVYWPGATCGVPLMPNLDSILTTGGQPGVSLHYFTVELALTITNGAFFSSSRTNNMDNNLTWAGNTPGYDRRTPQARCGRHCNTPQAGCLLPDLRIYTSRWACRVYGRTPAVLGALGSCGGHSDATLWRTASRERPCTKHELRPTLTQSQHPELVLGTELAQDVKLTALHVAGVGLTARGKVQQAQADQWSTPTSEAQGPAA